MLNSDLSLGMETISKRVIELILDKMLLLINEKYNSFHSLPSYIF
jgi:hypothetical protein